MLTLALICTAYLALSSLVQLIWAWRFTILYRRSSSAPTPDEDLPRAAVVLSLRGADPSLPGCLQGLLMQDYPRYDVKIIIDSREDPAWELVQRAVAEAGVDHVEIQELEDPSATCSLKLSALVQAVGRLDPEHRVVALIDADVHAYPGWLRDLVTPLSEPGVGASNGVRWFLPAESNCGTLVRYLWNAAASTQMHAFHIPWGGSLAFRADVLRDAGLLDDWRRCFCEDTGSYRALRALGLTIRVVGAATMISREATDLSACCRFVRRQLLAARLYHESWSWVLSLGLANAATLLLAAVLGAAFALHGHWAGTAWMVGLIVAQFLSLAAGLLGIERPIRSLLRARGEPLPPLPWRVVLKTLLAIPLTFAVQTACLLSAAVARRVNWRGITYELNGPRDIRLVRYYPFRPPEETPQREASLI
jgi:cellulose synthase/poly-beta-1,6-N-acetylglucosamine synthase-like glycosyltransferase